MTTVLRCTFLALSLLVCATQCDPVEATILDVDSSGGVDQHCIVELRYYDSGSLSYLLFQDNWLLAECVSPIDGVTVTPASGGRPGRSEVKNFPTGFHGPATILTCDFFYFDDECAPSSLDPLEKTFGIVRALDGNGVDIQELTVCPVRFECSHYCPLAPPGPYIAGTCGDANADGAVTATDALMTLQAAVGIGECLPEQCDADADSLIDSTDALRVLAAAVGQSGVLNCPFSCEADTPSGG